VLVLGSQNSSNSQRLKELGVEKGKRAFLVDGKEDIDPEWFDGSERVMVTAGASAPESVVQETIEWLCERYGATLREQIVKTEDVQFPLPKALRQIAKEQSA
jgi:4-hydroxy-3-methylbut-2-enyl diphosphate reductase